MPRKGEAVKAAGCAKDGSCHTCRRQRHRCDGARPECNKCLRKGIECLGYGPKAILWVQTRGSSRSSAEDNDSTEEISCESPPLLRSKKRGRPKLAFMPQADEESISLAHRPKKPWQFLAHRPKQLASQEHDRGYHRLDPAPVIYPNLSPDGYASHHFALEVLQYCMSSIQASATLKTAKTTPR